MFIEYPSLCRTISCFELFGMVGEAGRRAPGLSSRDSFDSLLVASVRTDRNWILPSPASILIWGGGCNFLCSLTLLKSWPNYSIKKKKKNFPSQLSEVHGQNKCEPNFQIKEPYQLKRYRLLYSFFPTAVFNENRAWNLRQRGEKALHIPLETV